MLALLLLLLWPIAELFVAIKIAEAIGVLLTVVLLIIGWPLGLWLAKTEGRAAWRRLSSAVAAGRYTDVCMPELLPQAAIEPLIVDPFVVSAA